MCSQREHRIHSQLEQTQPSKMTSPAPGFLSLLGKEGFQSCQQSTGPQAIGELSTSVNSCRCQAKEFVHRVAQLLNAVNHFPMLLGSRQRQTKASSDLRMLMYIPLTQNPPAFTWMAGKPTHLWLNHLRNQNTIPNCNGSKTQAVHTQTHICKHGWPVVLCGW